MDSIPWLVLITWCREYPRRLHQQLPWVWGKDTGTPVLMGMSMLLVNVAVLLRKARVQSVGRGLVGPVTDYWVQTILQPRWMELLGLRIRGEYQTRYENKNSCDVTYSFVYLCYCYLIEV